jgi:FKBP-type peptidyl-prolyl cis-trans isomerase
VSLKKVFSLRKLALAILPVFLVAGCATAEPNLDPAAPKGYTELSIGLRESCESYQTGSAVEQIKVLGDFGQQPEVTFPTPLSGQGVETQVVISGEGGKIVGGQRVSLHFLGFNAATGDEIQGSEFGTENFISQDLIEGATPDFCKALTGVNVGSRVAVLLDAASAHNSRGIPSLGIAEDAGVIFIFDVVGAYLPKANGQAKSPESGMPTVITAPNGQPGIQIPASDAPTEFRRTVLIDGGGEPIEVGDTVVLHYSGWTWNGEQFDSSWNSKAPATFPITYEGLIDGFVMGLEGVTVGSQVIAVIPPELGYGDSAQGSIPAGSTLIFVIDVLGKG